MRIISPRAAYQRKALRHFHGTVSAILQKEQEFWQNTDDFNILPTNVGSAYYVLPPHTSLL